jgi:chromosome partitioning protein
VVNLADLVIVPTRPSPHDLRAAGATVDLVETAGKPLVFVVNAAKMRARITSEAAIALSQHGTVAPTTVHQRTDFAAAMIDGRTVMELPRSTKSAEEVTELWRYIDERLNGGRRATMLTGAQTGTKAKSGKRGVVPDAAATV